MKEIAWRLINSAMTGNGPQFHASLLWHVSLRTLFSSLRDVIEFENARQEMKRTFWLKMQLESHPFLHFSVFLSTQNIQSLTSASQTWQKKKMAINTFHVIIYWCKSGKQTFCRKHHLYHSDFQKTPVIFKSSLFTAIKANAQTPRPALRKKITQSVKMLFEALWMMCDIWDICIVARRWPLMLSYIWILGFARKIKWNRNSVPWHAVWETQFSVRKTSDFMIYKRKKQGGTLRTLGCTPGQ